MEYIGSVQRVQIQQRPMKVGEGADRWYDPAALLTVDSLLLFPDGCLGLTADGGRLTDVHHAAHPQTRNRRDNGISIGLTAYYGEMRARFGAHMTDGIAGENIILETTRPYTLAELGAKLTFENPATGARFELAVKDVVAPCVPFSQFAAQRRLEGDDQKETLQFLNDGRRGFLLSAANDGFERLVQAGDRVYRG